jgi:hypothetical protein
MLSTEQSPEIWTVIAIFWLCGIMELTDAEAEEASPCDCSSIVRLQDIGNAELRRSMLLVRDTRHLEGPHYA